MSTAIITNAGAALIAAALVGGPPITLSQMAMGTGLAAPDPAQSALQVEVFRVAVNAVIPDPSDPTMLVVEMVIGPQIGGWTLTEAGVFTSTGELFAVASIDPLPKPDPGAGGPVEILVRLAIQVNSPAVVNLDLDSALLASRNWVLTQIQDYPLVRQPWAISPTAPDSTEERPFLTASAYYSLYSVPHGASQYQVRLVTDTDWAAPLYDTGEGTATPSYRLPGGLLVVDTDYLWRTRHKDVEGVWSDWSVDAAFSTLAIFNAVQAPAIISPMPGATGVAYQGLVLSAGTFEVLPGADTHATSRFQVRLATDPDWSTPLYDSGEVPAAMSHAVPDGLLDITTEYLWRVNYTGTALGAGAWSTAAFTTTVPSGNWASNGGGSFTVPDNVTRIKVFVVGGHAGGLPWDDVWTWQSNFFFSGYGGNAAKTLDVQPGDVFTAIAGAGGVGGIYPAGANTAGGSSSVTGPGLNMSATGGGPGTSAGPRPDGVGIGGDTNGFTTALWAAMVTEFFLGHRQPGTTGVSGAPSGGDGSTGDVGIIWGPGI